MNMKKLTISLIAAVALAVSFTACKTHKLEPGGAYAPATLNVTTNADLTTTTNVVETAAPDQALFEVDSAFELAYMAVDTAFKLEKQNRELLWSISPSIKHTLDDIRPKALEAVQRYTKFRRIYLLQPTPAGLSQLQTILSQMQSFSTAAQGALPRKS